MPRHVPDNPPGTRGLKRDPALVPLSREHHFALMQAQALARAARSGAGPALKRARGGYLRWFAEEGEPHFVDEEELLLPALETSEPATVARVREEHVQLRTLTSRLAGSRSAGTPVLSSLLAEIGALLHDHVRFEERVLFEVAQKALAPAILKLVGRQLGARRQARHGVPPCPTRERDG